ncbi:hypothetical protein METUNv1_01344 [Methyloversatilis universalis FAM5]|uniref:Uncharacterized protein n=1 Tax=Methyloversatilis universalis (strain ATCC BAA-1314 / DSM 25237 / JCM 13912 / CCUG 52030 / FAM5) TaxID=1000565 RepID=F5RAQ9_METUF|nr:hypothetical protein METUNv1_01344 [Methyloversatilis universalis FAM5]
MLRMQETWRAFGSTSVTDTPAPPHCAMYFAAVAPPKPPPTTTTRAAAARAGRAAPIVASTDALPSTPRKPRRFSGCFRMVSKLMSAPSQLDLRTVVFFAAGFFAAAFATTLLLATFTSGLLLRSFESSVFFGATVPPPGSVGPRVPLRGA